MPTASVTRMPTIKGMSALRTMPNVTAHMPKMEPTEMSMPPLMMTGVMPRAMIPMKQAF